MKAKYVVPLKAKYVAPADCESCLDLGWYNNCSNCLKWRTQEVEILEFSYGCFGSKAIIKYKDGQLDTVPIKTLTILDKENTK